MTEKQTNTNAKGLIKSMLTKLIKLIKLIKKNGLIRAVFDVVFVAVLCAQASAVKFEKWHEDNKENKKIIWIKIVITVILVLLIYISSNKFQNVSVESLIELVALILVIGYNRIVDDIGWRSSTIECLKVCLIYSYMGSTFLSLLTIEFVPIIAFLLIFIFSFLLIWIFMSLIANSKVALLMNEVVSGFTATIFTIATYIISITEYDITFLLEENTTISLKNIFEFLFLLLLPIIGVSAFSVIMVKLKQYWMDKNGRIEPGVN